MITPYYVAVGNDDWDVDQDAAEYHTNATIHAGIYNQYFPIMSSIAYADVDTSGIADDAVITNATVSFNESSYVASKGVAKTYNFYIWTGSVWELLASYTFTTATTRTYTLTEAQRAYINKTGYTKFRWMVDDPGGSNNRAIVIKAFETSQAVACRMNITTPDTNAQLIGILNS